ncbi:BMP family ABC transporter substrate-binding protein [Desulforhopalus sp. 52FAK]
MKTIGFLVGSGGLGDQSYNDMTLTGLGKAQQEHNFKLIIEESFGTTESQEKALKKLLDEHADIIVANGAGLDELIIEHAPQYPDRYFVVNSSAIEGYANIASTVFAHEEGSYLAGLLAASYSKTGKIGFIGGVNIPQIQKFLTGYTKGAKKISPELTIISMYMTEAGDFSGFDKPNEGLQIANQMYNDGVDIIYAVAGLTGNGVIQAALRKNKMAIGVDSDQDHMAKGHVLTSMMKRLDRSTYAEINQILRGDFKPGVKFYSLNNGGVSLSPMRFTRHLISDKTFELLEQAEQDIINGKIRFP